MLALLVTAALAQDPAGLALTVSPTGVTVTGAAPGQSVQIAASTRPGSTCGAALHGACLGLRDPYPIAAQVADERGVVELAMDAPRLPPGTRMYVQAVATGPGPADLSPVVAR